MSHSTDPIIRPSSSVEKWLHSESQYQWAKFSVQEESDHLLDSGLDDESYWSAFIGNRWLRFQLIYKNTQPLRAAQDLLKETATTVAAGVCLRHIIGQSLEAANYEAISVVNNDAIKYTTGDLDSILSITDFRDTPMYSNLLRAHNHLINNEGADISSAKDELDHMVKIEAAVADRYVDTVLSGLMPKPGISSSEDVIPWDN